MGSGRACQRAWQGFASAKPARSAYGLIGLRAYGLMGFLALWLILAYWLIWLTGLQASWLIGFLGLLASWLLGLIGCRLTADIFHNSCNFTKDYDQVLVDVVLFH